MFAAAKQQIVTGLPARRNSENGSTDRLTPFMHGPPSPS
jgi:hypothetical protein